MRWHHEIPKNVLPFPTVVAISGFAQMRYLAVPKENAFSPGVVTSLEGIGEEAELKIRHVREHLPV
jgi:hypothetical protein